MTFYQIKCQISEYDVVCATWKASTQQLHLGIDLLYSPWWTIWEPALGQRRNVLQLFASVETSYLSFSRTWTSCGGSVTAALINRDLSLWSALLHVCQNICLDMGVKDRVSAEFHQWLFSADWIDFPKEGTRWKYKMLMLLYCRSFQERMNNNTYF